jgi:hypothetical protein
MNEQEYDRNESLEWWQNEPTIHPDQQSFKTGGAIPYTRELKFEIKGPEADKIREYLIPNAQITSFDSMYEINPLDFDMTEEIKAPLHLEITQVLDELEELLLNKNRKYGNSALDPIRIFSKADPIEQLKVRIDDKLSRVKSGQLDEDESVDIDLIGYLVLKIIAQRKQS